MHALTFCPSSLLAPSSTSDADHMVTELQDGTSPPSSRSFERMAEELAVVFSAAPLAPLPPKVLCPRAKKGPKSAG
ncbi:hypothetical protein Cni_G09676 [Canna indica]|uniref:Uncharacterized protein n=1 Tax=Canna indica TaxID=4628 RepID=A0AAQ3K2X5_9LILI|nr:hypothetical protein Cni_G09676 [Canna indica]